MDDYNKTMKMPPEPEWYLRNAENENDSLYQLFLNRYDLREDEMKEKDPYKVLELAEGLLKECFIYLKRISQSRKKLKSRLKFFNEIGVSDRINPFRDSSFSREIFKEMLFHSKEDEHKYEDPIQAVRQIFEEDIILFNDSLTEAGNISLTHIIEDVLDPEIIMEEVGNDTENEIGSEKYDAACWKRYKEKFHYLTGTYTKGNGVFDWILGEEFEKAYKNKIQGNKITL